MNGRRILAASSALAVLILVVFFLVERRNSSRAMREEGLGSVASLEADIRDASILEAPVDERRPQRHAEFGFSIKAIVTGTDLRGRYYIEVRNGLRQVSVKELAGQAEHVFVLQGAGNYSVQLLPTKYLLGAMEQIELTEDCPSATVRLTPHGRRPIPIYLMTHQGEPLREAWKPPRTVVPNELRVEVHSPWPVKVHPTTANDSYPIPGAGRISKRSPQEPGMYGYLEVGDDLPGRLELLVGEEVLAERTFVGTEDRLEFALWIEEMDSVLCDFSLRVLDAFSNAPIPHSSGFTISTTSSLKGKVLVRTNEIGEGRLLGIPPGAYWLIVRAPGFIPRAEPIRFEVGLDMHMGDVRLEPASLIAGRILNEEGEPIEVVPRVSVPEAPLTPIGEYPDVANEDGWFSVGGLPRGHILCSLPGAEWALNPVSLYIDQVLIEDIRITAQRGHAVTISVPGVVGSATDEWMIFDDTVAQPLLLWSGIVRGGGAIRIRLLPGSYVVTQKGEDALSEHFSVVDGDLQFEIET